MKDITVKVRDFNETPGAATPEQTPGASGKEFLEQVLYPEFIKAMAGDCKLIIDMDGAYGYANSFLHYAFHNLVSLTAMDPYRVWDRLQFISEEEMFLPDQIKDYVIGKPKTRWQRLKEGWTNTWAEPKFMYPVKVVFKYYLHDNGKYRKLIWEDVKVLPGVLSVEDEQTLSNAVAGFLGINKDKIGNMLLNSGDIAVRNDAKNPADGKHCRISYTYGVWKKGSDYVISENRSCYGPRGHLFEMKNYYFKF